MQWIEPHGVLTNEQLYDMMVALYEQKIVDTPQIIMHPNDMKIMEDIFRDKSKTQTT